MNSPLVTIALFYNRDDGFLKFAKKSIELQEYKNIEVIEVNNNASTSINLNKCLELANGDYFKLLAADDELVPNTISDLVNGIDQYDFICANSIMRRGISSNKDYIFKSRPCTSVKDLLKNNSIHGGTTMYKMSSILSVGGYDETLRCGEELDLHFRLLLNNKKMIYIDKTVYIYRKHRKQKSNFDNSSWRAEEIAAIKRRYRNA